MKSQNFQEKLEKILMPIATKISNQRHLAAVRNAMTVLIPLTSIGGIFALLAAPPVNPESLTGVGFFDNFLLTWYNWSKANNAILMLPYRLTIGSISIYLAGAVAFRLAERYNIPKIESCVSATVVFLIIAGAPIKTTEAGNAIPLSGLGAGSMFNAIIVSLIVVEIINFCIKHDVSIKMPDAVPPNVAAPFKILIPLTISLVGFLLLDALCQSVAGFGLNALLTNIMTPFLSATESFPSFILLLVISQTLWFFGIHGDNMINPIVTPIITANIALNMEAYNSGAEMTHIFAGQFHVYWSGWVTGWAILIAMFIVAKSEQLRTICKLAPLSTLFNINEPLVFGIPTVLNIFMLIPMLICIFLNISVAYFLTYIGFLGKPYILLPGTTPAPLAAFLSTMDWKAPIVWFILCAINVIILIPFIKKHDQQLLKQEKSIEEK